MFIFVLDHLKHRVAILRLVLRHDVDAISTSVGFLRFSALWLTGDHKEEHKKGKIRQDEVKKSCY
jgi:hypothetical protein